MSISKVNVSNTDHQIVGSPRYATCSTAAATAAKVATIADGSSAFTLEKGVRICVSFTYANTASAATLNVAGTGAKAICWQGSALVSSQYWQAGAVVDFVYDGNGWSIVGVAKDNNSTNFLPLSGGTLTGSLTVGSSSIGTNGYIEGTWLKTTAAGDKAGDFATIDSSGWVYKRTPAETLGDIGGQAKITASGLLKGDGAGTITAADETEVELVEITPESIGAQSKITANGFLTSDGEGNIAADKPVLCVIATSSGSGEERTIDSVDKTVAEIVTAYQNGYSVVLKLDDNGCIFHLEYVSSSASYKSVQFTCFDINRYTKYDIQGSASSGSAPDGWYYYVTNLFRDQEYIKIKRKRVLDAIQDLQNMIKVKSVSLPTASWTGSDPYTQTISISLGGANTQASIQLSDTLYDQLVADSVTYLNIENNNGTFTAKAKGGKPSVDLTVQITCTETT